MKNIFKGKKKEEKVIEQPQAEVPLEEKEAVNPNENAEQQKEFTKLLKKKNLSYGEILKARRGERKAKVIARGSKGDQGEQKD